jgi:hypothetical protein
MKIPAIRHLHKTCSREQLEKTLEVLENYCEFRSIKEEELDVIGELITNICGAVEVHEMVKRGMTEIEASNTFSKKVLGSIDV